MDKKSFLIFCFLCVGILLFGRQGECSSFSREPCVKVLIAKDAPSALLEVKGSYRVIRNDANGILSGGSIGKRYVVHALKDGLRWGEEYPDVYRFCVAGQSPETMMYVNGIQYRGSILVFHTGGNLVTLVNEVPVEDFLKSTLAIQYPSPLSDEAMAALVIAARTEIYARIANRAAAAAWDFTADEAHYWGYGATHQKNRLDQVVDATRLMILESTQTGALAKNITLPKAKAEELAKKGCDAKRIIANTFPHTKIGIKDPAL